MRDQAIVEIDFDEIVTETDRAILIRRDLDEAWIPISQIISEDGSVLEIPEWLALEKGLI